MTYRHSVFKDWVFELPYRMQSVLMSALRGCDTARKDDPSKFITRALRPILLNNADPSNTYMVGDGIPDPKVVETFLWDIDSYPMHFIMHTAHAAEIVGYKHPVPRVREWWSEFYFKMMKGLHVNPETEEQLDVRLGFTSEEKRMLSEAERPLEIDPPKKVKTKADAKWDAGTGTSHGGRERSYSGSS